MPTRSAAHRVMILFISRVLEFPEQDGLARAGRTFAAIAVVQADFLQLHPEHLGEVPEREAVGLHFIARPSLLGLPLLAGQVHDGIRLQLLLVGQVVVAQNLLGGQLISRCQGAVAISLDGHDVRHAVAKEDLAGLRQGQRFGGGGDAEHPGLRHLRLVRRRSRHGLRQRLLR